MTATDGRKCTDSYESVPRSVRNGTECLVEDIPSVTSSVTSAAAHKEAIRASLAKVDPGLLNLLDLARGKFPAAKLSGLETHDGQLALGVFAKGAKP